MAFTASSARLRTDSHACTTAASTVTYVIPVVSTVAGLVLLGERLSWNEPVGALVVLAGIALGQGLLRYPRGSTRPSAAGRP